MTVPGNDSLNQGAGTPPPGGENPAPPAPPVLPTTPPTEPKPPEGDPKTVPLEHLTAERKKRQEQEAATAKAIEEAKAAREELQKLREAHMTEDEKAKAAQQRMLEEQEKLKADAARAKSLDEKIAAFEARDKAREERLGVLLASQTADLSEAQKKVVDTLPGTIEDRLAAIAQMRLAGMLPRAGYSDRTRLGGESDPPPKPKTLEEARKGFQKAIQERRTKR